MVDRDDSHIYPKLSEISYWEFDRNSKQGPYEWHYFIEIRKKWGSPIDGNYHITADGMSIDNEDGSAVHTNVTPRTLFPNCEYGLTDDQLMKLVNMPVEGLYRSRWQMEELYKQFQEWENNQ
jgi:hypothetical protein